MPTIVADIGNTRIKWATWSGGRLLRPQAHGLDDLLALLGSFRDLDPTWPWAISSVNPPAASRVAEILGSLGVRQVTWLRSAADVGVANLLEFAERTGADRALAVRGALGLHGGLGPGLVVSCGTALTVERIGQDGVWHGGAIAPGLGLLARSLHQGTAQLPEILPQGVPPAWGTSTEPAIAAGVVWGSIGAIRELLARQAVGLVPDPWLVWTGGDADRLAPAIEWTPGRSRIVPELVLLGLVDWLKGNGLA